MFSQLDLFEVPEKTRIPWTNKHYWTSLGWDGPTPGGHCDITGSIIVELESGGSIYAYMEQCRLIEKRQDGKWLAVIDMGIVHGHPWGKDGTRVILPEEQIWPPMREM